ncbi:MAG: Druantia anti-phage system protein DruA [Candidatus Sulfotelmatobacter sp.]
MNRDELRRLILHSLRKQGFRRRNGLILPPSTDDKDHLRSLHSTAVDHKVTRSAPGLKRHEEALLTSIAVGKGLDPAQIRPALIEVRPDSQDELLFRYATLHWAIPVSSGYGRRIRFLVMDEYHKKLIGVIGLGDPVFNLAVRDSWIGWSKEAHRTRLGNVMDAFVLGAVPPYSHLLCGKLVAMLAASREVREAFNRKYRSRRSVIRRKVTDGRVALVTTMSALGRSSIYNRLRYEDRLLFHSLGYSQGSGEFHFSNGLYGAIFDYADRYCDATAKKSRWGVGFRNRREVIRKTLAKIGLPPDLLYHGIQREVFAVPLAQNTREFLRGETSKLKPYKTSVNDLFAWFRTRWLLPRASRDMRYREFNPDSYRLWSARACNG